ncbi:MAG: putative sulfate exporter family transporter, partial [Alistipes sp.]|nr:putative sulfate exporter family transporter [Alistipes sp.]
MKKFRTEDWIVTFLSIPLIILIGYAGLLPNGGPKIPETLATWHDWLSIGIFFAIALVMLFVGNKLLGKPLRGLLASFIVIFIIALAAQWVAKLEVVKFYGFEAVFFSVIFGLIIRNAFRVPEWLKPAIQGEFFIKIGVICLGATVLFSDVMKS